jgi:TrmH family RNA methyltransferase
VPERITSRENRMIKLCRKLRSGARERREEGLFLAEGVRLCREALEAGLGECTLLATPDAAEKHPWLAEKASLILITPELAGYISDTATPQGVFCLCPLPEKPEPSLDPGGRYLLLDNLQDPGNLGTIIRGAEAFGITGLFLSPGCPDCFSPKVLRSTMGSIFRQPVHRCQDLPGELRRMRDIGIQTYAATLNPGAVGVQALENCREGLAVVVGNEGNGVSREVIDACGAAVYIPMSPVIESLNAAAAATVIMWEMAGRAR